MYEAYWKLGRKPFECGADPSIYYPSEAHQASLLKLRYALESHSGAALLAGPSGSGKTLLVRLLSERLSEAFRPVVHLVYPAMQAAELLALLAGELGHRVSRSSMPALDESIFAIQQAVAERAAAGRHTVVVVDEAHLIEGRRALEALRLLLNFEVQGRPALSLLLVGQPALLPLVDRAPELEERLAVTCLLRPLTVEETMSYVQHRLATAGATQLIFTQSALEAIHRLADGIPRRINRLCDLALLIGYAEERSQIGAEQIESIAGELVAVGPE